MYIRQRFDEKVVFPRSIPPKPTSPIETIQDTEGLKI